MKRETVLLRVQIIVRTRILDLVAAVVSAGPYYINTYLLNFTFKKSGKY